MRDRALSRAARRSLVRERAKHALATGKRQQAACVRNLQKRKQELEEELAAAKAKAKAEAEVEKKANAEA